MAPGYLLVKLVVARLIIMRHNIWYGIKGNGYFVVSPPAPHNADGDVIIHSTQLLHGIHKQLKGAVWRASLHANSNLVSGCSKFQLWKPRKIWWKHCGNIGLTQHTFSFNSSGKDGAVPWSCKTSEICLSYTVHTGRSRSLLQLSHHTSVSSRQTFVPFQSEQWHHPFLIG